MNADTRRIYFRADADNTIGYGHFMRTLALAEVLSDDYDCVFATQSPSPFQKDCLRGVCQLLELPADDSRFRVFADLVHQNDIVVLDNYFYDSQYEILLRDKGATVVFIDNLHVRHSCADAIIGFLLGLNAADYSVEPYTKLFLGTEYSLLRKPFMEQLKIRHQSIENYDNLKIVISFGGADQYGVAVSIANILEQSDCVCKITVIGRNTAGLVDSPKIEFKRDLSAYEMRDAFLMNDIAVLPASTTTLEALACGIPVIGGYFVDNQVGNYKQYIKAKAIIGCGCLLDISNQKKIRTLIESKKIGDNHQTQSIIPLDVKQKLLSIFEEL